MRIFWTCLGALAHRWAPVIGKRVLRCLASTRGFGLFYAAISAGDTGARDVIALKVYYDASLDDVGTLSGVVTTMFGHVMDWRGTRRAVPCTVAPPRRR